MQDFVLDVTINRMHNCIILLREIARLCLKINKITPHIYVWYTVNVKRIIFNGVYYFK